MRYTFAQFRKEYPDDAACLRSVLENRYGNTCPRCGVIGVKWHPITGRKGFVCSECDRHVYPLADTIFRKSETSLWNWFYAIYQFSVAKNGVSAKELERTLGCTYKTAWRMAKQIRLLMAQESGLLTGVVETDETYIGGRKKGKDISVQDKETVFGMVERDGIILAEHVSGAGTRVLLPRMLSNIAIGTTVYSDQASVYRNLKHYGYTHASVNHGKGEYGRGVVHTNTIEGFWGNWKKSMRGTYNYVSPKYLQQYLNEFAFRYNHRTIAVFPVLLARAGKRA
ncbi:MAG TPA: IS1595 family transposase [Candidatus Saccharimonadales bacterium]